MNRADKETEDSSSTEEGEEPLNTPNGKATTGRVSRKRWIEMMNAADPFEQSLRAQNEKSSGSEEEPEELP